MGVIPEKTEGISDETEAIPAQQAVPTSKPSPATDAYAHGGGNRGTLFGMAALVVVVLALAFAAWQFMGRLDADETSDPEAATAQAAPRARPTKSVNSETDAAETDNDATPEPETPAATVSDSASAPQAQTPANEGDVGAEPAARQPQPTQPQPDIEEPALVVPPTYSIVAVTSSEYEYVDLVNTWFEGAFADQQFEVIDFQSSPYETLAEAARFHVVTTATLISTRPLEYFGNVQTQYTVALTTRVTDLSNGVTVVGPKNATLRYTSINMEQNLEKATADLARSMARELRQLIRRP